MGCIAEKIAVSLMPKAHNIFVRDVRIGLAYTAVQLEDDSLGVALTFLSSTNRCCAVHSDLAPFSGRVAADLLPLLLSTDPIEAAVGLACANGLTNRQQDSMQEGDILEHLDLTPADHVGMVGHFGPLVEPLQKLVKSLTIFEQVEKESGILQPAAKAKTCLPDCQVALITATSILNNTIDDLLQASSNCRVVAILGASTPMLPEVFSHTRVSLLSGVLPSDATSILRTISEGGGMRYFKSYIRKVNIHIPEKV